MIPTGLSVKVLGQKLNIAMRHLNGISTEFPSSKIAKSSYQSTFNLIISREIKTAKSTRKRSHSTRKMSSCWVHKSSLIRCWFLLFFSATGGNLRLFTLTRNLAISLIDLMLLKRSINVAVSEVIAVLTWGLRFCLISSYNEQVARTCFSSLIIGIIGMNNFAIQNRVLQRDRVLQRRVL